MQNFLAVTVPLDPQASYLHTQHEANRTWQQPRPSFAWILPICNIIFPIIDQCRHFLPLWWLGDFYLLILKSFLFLSNKNTVIWSKERSMRPYVAKMLFLQVDEGFWWYCCLIRKYLNQYFAFQFCSYRSVVELRKI